MVSKRVLDNAIALRIKNNPNFIILFFPSHYKLCFSLKDVFMLTLTIMPPTHQASNTVMPMASASKAVKIPSQADAMELRFAGDKDTPSRKKVTLKKRFWTGLAGVAFVFGGFNMVSPAVQNSDTVGAETQQDNIERASDQADEILIPDLTILTNDAKSEALQSVAESIDAEMLAYLQEQGSDVEVKALLTQLAPALMNDSDHAEAVDLILSEAQNIVTPGDTESFARLMLTHAGEFNISESDLITYLDELDAFTTQALVDETNRANSNDSQFILGFYGFLLGIVSMGNRSDNKKKLDKMEPEDPKNNDPDPDNDLDIKSLD